MGISAPGAYFFSFFAGGWAGASAVAAAGGLRIGARAGAATGAEALVGLGGALARTGALVVRDADEMGTVREAVVLAWTRAEDGVTEARTLATPGDDWGRIPLAALSSADSRMARLMWAVAVAGRMLGAGDEDTAGVLGVAGANFLAGVTAAAGALGTAWDFLCVLVDSCLDGDFLVELLASLAEEETFLVASGAFAWVVKAECFVSWTVLVALSVADLALEDEEGFIVEDVDGIVFELALTLGFDDGDGAAA